eukprot:g1355.t1
MIFSTARRLPRAPTTSSFLGRLLSTKPGASSVNTEQHALAEALRGEQNAEGPHAPNPDKAGAFRSAVEQYNEDGYVILRSVLDPDLVAEMSDHVDWLAEKYPDIPPEHYHHTIMRNDPFWLRVVADPRLVDVAQGFLGTPDVALFSSHYFCKPPFTGQRLQDLVDDRSTQNVLGAATHTDEDIDEADVVDLVLNPGDVSIHHPNIVHGSEANDSARRRCGLTIRFIPTTTECTQPEQPVMLLRGDPVPGINEYRSWPPFRQATDFAFKDAGGWNARRYVNPDDEWFFEQDPAAIEEAILKETLGFVDILGGQAEN